MALAIGEWTWGGYMKQDILTRGEPHHLRMSARGPPDPTHPLSQRTTQEHHLRGLLVDVFLMPITK
jgi:hypothetical protein